MLYLSRTRNEVFKSGRNWKTEEDIVQCHQDGIVLFFLILILYY